MTSQKTECSKGVFTPKVRLGFDWLMGIGHTPTVTAHFSPSLGRSAAGSQARPLFLSLYNWIC